MTQKTTDQQASGQPVLDAIEQALLQGASSDKHRARNIARCIAEAGYEITPTPTPGTSPRGAYLEVIEYQAQPLDEAVMLPNEVRLNGVPLLQPEGESIRVSASLGRDEFVTAQLELVCRRIVVEPRERSA